MILLWGLKKDSPMSRVAEELEAAGADYFFLDHRRIFQSDIGYNYMERTGGRCLLHTDGVTIDLEQVRVAYARPYNFYDYPEMDGKTGEDPLAVKAAGFESQLLAFLNASDALVINRLDPSATNNSKPLQLAIIRQTGLKIPETFISNDSEAVSGFLTQHPDSIYKSISGIRSIVQLVSPVQLGYLKDVQWCPTLFQKQVPGINYRVHALKDQLFSCRIESDRLDYRYGNTTMVAEALPPEVGKKCLELNKLLGLDFSGIDLMRTPEDEWFCFEVNPSPAFPYFEYHSGLPIGKALAACFIAADQPRLFT